MNILYNIITVLTLVITMTEQVQAMIVGHRGCRGIRPENTLAAFEHALKLGVDAVELDVHLTKDGKVVVYHDYNLSSDLTRDANGNWLVKHEALKNLTWDELRSYKLGKVKPNTPYAVLFPDVQNVDDAPLPQLKDVFELVRAYPDVHILIEVKTSWLKPFESSDPVALSNAVMGEINASGLKDRCAILAFDTRVLKHVKLADPSIPLYLNYMDHTLDNTSGLEMVGYKILQLFDGDLRKPGPVQAHDLGASYWSSSFSQITPESVQQAHDLGLKVMAWTVNSPEDAKRLLQMGVDTIATDRPDIMIEALRDEGRAPLESYTRAAG